METGAGAASEDDAFHGMKCRECGVSGSEPGNDAQPYWHGQRQSSEQNALAACSGTEIRKAWMAWPERRGGKAVGEKSV